MKDSLSGLMCGQEGERNGPCDYYRVSPATFVSWSSRNNLSLSEAQPRVYPNVHEESPCGSILLMFLSLLFPMNMLVAYMDKSAGKCTT